MTNILTFIECRFTELEGAYSPNTLKSYYADARAFVDWCETNSFIPFPLASATLRDYIDSRDQIYTYITMRRRISALRRVNSILGYVDVSRTEEVYLAMRRLKRNSFHMQRQAAGINAGLLTEMIQAQPETLNGIRNRALLSLGYDFLARRSELVALRVSDIQFEADGSLRGIIRRSKSDPFGRGRLVFGSKRSAELLKHWLKLKPKTIDPIFCAVMHGTCIDRALCDRSVSEIIKRSTLKVRDCKTPNVRDVSGHSLRVGAAQDLLSSGRDIAAIMRAGGWSNTAIVSRYLRLAEQNIWS